MPTGKNPSRERLDASALLRGENGQVLSDAHVVFYDDLKSPDGSVEHTGDDEVIDVILTAVPADVTARWTFRAVGQGYASGLAGIAQDFGVHV